MKQKIQTFILVLSLLALSLTGCGKKSGEGTAEGALTPVILNEVAHSIFYAPMYVAMEEGYFADEGIDLTLVTGFGVNYLVQIFQFRCYALFCG